MTDEIVGKARRLYYMDNLRAFAMLLGVVFHGALAYSPMLEQFWFSADRVQSRSIDIFVWFSHIFRMPLFFLIAGFFACLLYDRGGSLLLFRNRVVRVAAPFFIFLPLLWILTFTIFSWAAGEVENKPYLLNFVIEMSQKPDAKPPKITTMHLWFLYYLCIFYAISLTLVKLTRLKLSAIFIAKPLLLLVIGPLFISISLLLVPLPYPAPENFMPVAWACGYFGCFYWMGWCFYRHQEILEKISPYCGYLLLLSIVAYTAYYLLLPDIIPLADAMAPPTGVELLTPTHITKAVLTGYIALFSVLAFLVLGKQFLNIESRMLRMIADSSYWIYLVHMPIIFFMQFALIDTPWSLWLKFTLVVTTTFGTGFISYLVFVKWTPVGWLLNGKKPCEKVTKTALIT